MLVWNAASWGLVFPLLVVRALSTGAHHPGVLIAASLVAVLPHLVLEALSYVTAGLAAVFASLLLTPDDEGVAAGPNLESCTRMLVMFVALLVTAAVLESYWTPFVLDAFPDT